MSEFDDRDREIAELKARIEALEVTRAAKPLIAGAAPSAWIGRLKRIPNWVRVLIVVVFGVGSITSIYWVVRLPRIPRDPEPASAASTTGANAAASVAAASAESGPSDAPEAAADPTPDINATSNFKAVLTCESGDRLTLVLVCFAAQGSGTDIQVEEGGLKKVYNFNDLYKQNAHAEIDVYLINRFSIRAQDASPYAKLHLVIYRISDGAKVYDSEADQYETVEFAN